MTTDDELRNLIALAGKATERPWAMCGCGKCEHVDSVPADCMIFGGNFHVESCEKEGYPYAKDTRTNTTFIVAAANLAAGMAAELLAARDELQRRRNFMEMYSPNSKVCKECGAYIQDGYNCGECGHDPTFDEGGDA